MSPEELIEKAEQWEHEQTLNELIQEEVGQQLSPAELLLYKKFDKYMFKTKDELTELLAISLGELNTGIKQAYDKLVLLCAAGKANSDHISKVIKVSRIIMHLKEFKEHSIKTSFNLDTISTSQLWINGDYHIDLQTGNFNQSYYFKDIADNINRLHSFLVQSIKELSEIAVDDELEKTNDE